MMGFVDNHEVAYQADVADVAERLGLLPSDCQSQNVRGANWQCWKTMRVLVDGVETRNALPLPSLHECLEGMFYHEHLFWGPLTADELDRGKLFYGTKELPMSLLNIPRRASGSDSWSPWFCDWSGVSAN